MLLAQNKSFGAPEVVKIVEVSTPKPKPHQILVRVYASTVSVADSRLRSRQVPRGFGFIMGLLFGFKKPKYSALGTDAAGEVVALGPGVTQFQIGDRVLANLGMRLGGHAQYVVLSETAAIAKIPNSSRFVETVALVFGATTALVFLRDKLKLQRGQRILIIGAGGSVGSSAVQLAKYFGAHVTGVCSEKKSSVVKNLGADDVIEYENNDWKKIAKQFDVILDTVGVINISQDLSYLSENVRVGLVVADLVTNLKSIFYVLFGKRKIYAGTVAESKKDLEYLLELYLKGQIKPLVSEVFPLEKIVDAHKIVDSGKKLGSVVIDMRLSNAYRDLGCFGADS